DGTGCGAARRPGGGVPVGGLLRNGQSSGFSGASAVSRSAGVNAGSPAFAAVRSGVPGLCGLWLATAALGAAGQHPVAPALAMVVLGIMVAWAAWRPGDLWFMLPAFLPVASF